MTMLTAGLWIHPPLRDENAAIHFVKYYKTKILSLIVGIKSYCDHFVSLLLLIMEYFSMNHPSSSSRTNSRTL